MPGTLRTIKCTFIILTWISFAIFGSTEHYGWEFWEEYKNVEVSQSGLIMRDNTLTTPSFGEKFKVTVYQDSNKEGRAFDINLGWGDCVDFPWTFNDWISSVDTYENCIILCKDVNCNGDCQKFGPYENNGLDLVELDLNDKASSISLCNSISKFDDDMQGDEPFGKVGTEESLISDTPADLSQISLYEDGYLRGNKLSVYITLYDTCMNLPESFNDKTSSVDTHGNCIKLCEHSNCSGQCKSFLPYTSSGHWLGEEFNDKASSISLCRTINLS